MLQVRLFILFTRFPLFGVGVVDGGEFVAALSIEFQQIIVEGDEGWSMTHGKQGDFKGFLGVSVH